MEDNKKENDDFYRRQDGDSNDTTSRETKAEPGESKQERPSYYYSYGPYNSAMNNEESAAAHNAGNTQEDVTVEMTPPKPVRTFSYNGSDNGAQDPMRNWQFEQPKKRGSSLKSTFIAFLAGAVVVGSLMFASDRMNLFTGTKGVMNSGAGSSSASSSGSTGSGAVKPTALSMGRPDNIAQIAEQSGPAVVKIETKVKSKATSRGNSLFDDPFFRQFFGDEMPNQQKPKSNTDQLVPGGMGTGFIFEKSGYILTNEHVIDGADEIWVTVQGFEEPFKATLLGNSYDLDLAALKIEPKDGKEFPWLPLGKAEDTNVGDWVVAIGNPYGFDHTVTVGVLSAKERPISIPDSQGTRNYKHLLQTDASINPGNSGGPLLNLNGEVIGINTAVSAQAQGIGFAIPTSTISSVLDNLKNNVKIPKDPAPFIGVTLAPIDKEWVSELKLENTEGAIVSDVVRKSPAFKAGIRPYDVIVEVNGVKAKTTAEVQSKIQALKVNEKATLGVMRDGKKESITVTIGDKNAETTE